MQNNPADRITGSRDNYLSALDGLRFTAAMLVAGGHYASNLGQGILPQMPIGVCRLQPVVSLVDVVGLATFVGNHKPRVVFVRRTFGAFCNSRAASTKKVIQHALCVMHHLGGWMRSEWIKNIWRR